VQPYNVLDDHQVPRMMRRLVSDNLLIPYLIASSGGDYGPSVRLNTVMRGHRDLRVEDFPFPLPGLGIDRV
jgi:hypothetical protein